LSEEIAEHVANTAHSEGQAVVVVRPRDEAERLAKVARARARLDGFPLMFSLEQEP
jgi:ATP-dependent Clp protease adapter protein ClpS